MKSGTFSSGRYVNNYGPWLTLKWEEIQQDISGNRTKLRLTLTFHWDAPGGISYSFINVRGNLQGSSFTVNGPRASGTRGSITLRRRDVWINHNSDGSKSVNLSGDIQSIGLRWSGVLINPMSVSGKATLTTIPRATTISAFSFASGIKPNTNVGINYTVDRKHGNFRHQIQLRDGGTRIHMWDNINSDGASSLTLPAKKVNDLLNRMSNTTSKSLTLRIATRSGVGGSWIGTAVTRNGKVTVDSSVSPTASGLSISQKGNHLTGDYLQSVSRVSASFNSSAGYGASVSTESISVNAINGNDTQSIGGSSGETTNPISNSGSYEVVATVRDSRGRTNTDRRTFTATAYTQPTIDHFSVVRREGAQATVDVVRTGSWTSLGGKNTLSVQLKRKQGNNAIETIDSTTENSTTGRFSRNNQYSGNNVGLSYDFQLTITDQFGNKADAAGSITTQRVVLDIHKNEGVGIGKLREKGVLDVDGEAYFRGNLVVEPTDARPSLELRSYDPNGHAYIEYFGNDGTRKGYVGFPSTNNNHLVLSNEHPSGSDGDIRFQTNTGRIRVGWDDVVGSGSNGNGQWVRFYDGTQICYGENVRLDYNNISSVKSVVTLPSNFVNSNYAVIPALAYTDQQYTRGEIFYENKNASKFDILWRLGVGENVNVGSSWRAQADWVAIGRWK